MLSSQDLAVFVTVADSGSVSEAAQQLHRTQPAVSQAIQRLEQAVGFALLDRSGYRARLTERGEIFLKRARATVVQANELQAFADVLARGNETRLCIGVHGALAPDALMPLLQQLPQRFPDTVLELRRGEGAAPLRWLNEGQVDLAIVVGAPPVNRHALELACKSLGEIEFVNVVRSDKLISSLAQDLAPLPQILVADFDDPAASFGVVEGHRYWRVGDHSMKLAAIVAGNGWGAVPTWMAQRDLDSGALSTISYRGIGPCSTHAYCLYQRNAQTSGPVAAHIWDQAGA